MQNNEAVHSLHKDSWIQVNTIYTSLVSTGREKKNNILDTHVNIVSVTKNRSFTNASPIWFQNRFFKVTSMDMPISHFLLQNKTNQCLGWVVTTHFWSYQINLQFLCNHLFTPCTLTQQLQDEFGVHVCRYKTLKTFLCDTLMRNCQHTAHRQLFIII